MKLLLNGQLTDQEKAVIPVYDHGFLYGMGLFETFRTYGGKPWLLDRHARRLTESCRGLGIRYEADPTRMAAGVSRLLAANGMQDAYIRWSVSAGTGELGLPSEDYGLPSEIVYTKPLAPDEPATRPGKRLRLLRLARTAPEAGGIRYKSFHYMNNIAAKRELMQGGASPGLEGLFLDGEGYVSEGLVSNVFWVKKGVLYTPGLETGPLAGITRAYVMEWAARLGLKLREGRYRWNALIEADEIFVTNSIQEIVPVLGLEDSDGRDARLPVEQAGPLTRTLMNDYRQAAERGDSE